MPVCQSYIKDICKEIMQKHSKIITTDFELNKQFLNENTEFYSNKIRNRVAGRLVVEKKNENRIIIPPYTGRPRGRQKGWKKKVKKGRKR